MCSPLWLDGPQQTGDQPGAGVEEVSKGRRSPPCSDLLCTCHNDVSVIERLPDDMHCGAYDEDTGDGDSVKFLESRIPL